MTDLDLTPEQWKMARQAGASFTDESDLEPVGEYGEQLPLDGTGPKAGELYRNVHTGNIGCVTRTTTRRRLWITLRHQGRLTEVTPETLSEHWERCHPDGTVL